MATQQEINDFVEQIMPYFDPTPVEDDAVQQSWPRLDRGLSDVQDMARFQHMYGIFDHGEYGYWLQKGGTDAEVNASNSMVLTAGRDGAPAQATLRGCFHRLREDITLEFPAVSTPTTYYVVISYDAVRAEDGGDPLEVEVVTSLSTSEGRDYLVLWEVDRRPSQLMTGAAIRRVRPRNSAVTYVWEESHKPDPEKALFGALCVVGETATIYRNDESGGVRVWINLTSPNWVEPGYSHLYQNPGHGHQIARKRSGRTVTLRGRMSRVGGTPFYPGNDYWIMTLPDGWKPSAEHRFRTPGHGFNPNNEAVIHVMTTGEVRAYPQSTMSWIGIDGVQWDTE